MDSKYITKNTFYDNLFIYFPFWTTITILLLTVNLSDYKQLVFIGTLFVLAETHFASTWLYFFDKDNWSWIKSKFYEIAILPILLIPLIILVWILNPSLVLITHYLASGFHVTKQSIGIANISKTGTRINKFLIYFSSFLSLGIGLKNPGFLAISLSGSSLNIMLILFIFIYFFILKASVNSSKFQQLFNKTIPIITGVAIYLPLLFFKNLALATIVGVAMHWCQYIALMWSINLRKKNRPINCETKKTWIGRFQFQLFFVISYSLIMTTVGYLGMPKNEISNSYSFLYLIPLLFQLYHFYIDGFIWKFSDPHIRNSVGKYIFSK